jgi:hypothetical protein
MVKEPSSGVEFPLVRTFWVGDAQRALGAAVRQKKFAFVGVKVYAVALFVEADRAAKELGVRERGGFFTDAPDSDYALAIIDGAFTKSLVIKLVRKVESEQFVGAIAEALEPRLRLSGEMSTLEKFKAFFQAKHSLEKGTTVTMLWRPEGVLELLLRDSDEGVDYARTQPDERIKSPSLCRALFEIYLGGSPVIPEAIGTWAAGTKKLLESENEKRNTRRNG